ncbi:MAG: metal ABC transporter ATP-binding protein [Syntrophomonadales bacterium]
MINKGNKNSKCDLCCTRLENFGVSIGGNILLYDVNLHIHCGELTGIIGPNGAGKTTLLKAIVGEIPFTGTMSFLDANGLRTGSPLIGYVPQKLDFGPGSPASVLDFCSACISNIPVWLARPRRNRQRVYDNLARVQAEHLINRRICELSGGELQRVLLACALDPVPNLLLLDEPVTGVDPRGLDLFYGMVSELRKEHDLSIIMVSHDHGMISRYADRIVLLDQTVLAVGQPSEVFHARDFVSLFGQRWTAELCHGQEAATTIHHPTREVNS